MRAEQRGTVWAYLLAYLALGLCLRRLGLALGTRFGEASSSLWSLEPFTGQTGEDRGRKTAALKPRSEALLQPTQFFGTPGMELPSSLWAETVTGVGCC